MSVTEKQIGTRSVEAMLAEVEKANPRKSDDGHTTRELASAWGVSENATKARLRVLADSGKLIVGQRPFQRIDGKSCSVPVYRLKRGK